MRSLIAAILLTASASGALAVEYHKIQSTASNGTITVAGLTISSTSPSALVTIQSNSAVPGDYLLKVSSANSGAFFYVRNNSHTGFGGPAPTFGTCANAALAANSNDTAGKISFSGANNTCALVWAVSRTNTPVCVCAGATNAGEGCQITAESTSGFTLAPLTGSWDNGDAINYICFGMKP